jgi:hypothetical protein
VTSAGEHDEGESVAFNIQVDQAGWSDMSLAAYDLGGPPLIADLRPARKPIPGSRQDRGRYEAILSSFGKTLSVFSLTSLSSLGDPHEPFLSCGNPFRVQPHEPFLYWGILGVFHAVVTAQLT